MRLIKILFFILITSTHVHAAVNVTSGHPRIWISSADLSTIITNCSGGGDLNAHYIELRDWAYSTTESTQGQTAPHAQRYWIGMALGALVDGGSYLTDLQTAINTMYTNRVALHSSEYRVAALAIVYDWCYSILTATDRQRIADTFVEWWDYQLSPSASERSTGNNHGHERLQGFILGSVALDGDGYCDTEAATALIEAESRMDEYMSFYGMIGGADSSLGIDGGYNEGMEYIDRGAYSLYGSYLAWETGTDDSINSEWLDNLGQWLYASTRNDNTTTRLHDIDAYYVNSLTGNPIRSSLYYWLAGDKADQYARYLWNKAQGGTGALTGASGEFSDSYDYIYAMYIVFYNSTSAVTPSAGSTFFDGVNHIMVREGVSATDNYFFFNAQDMWSGHEHFGAGGFEISRGSGLALDAGAYEGGDISNNDHAWLYYQRSLAHNVVSIYLSGETWEGPDWTNNDGGQNVDDWPLTNNFGHFPWDMDDYNTYTGSFDQGNILQYYSSSDACFFRADLSPGYDPSKIDFYYREFIIPSNGAYYILCDRLTTDSSTYTKRWLLHSETDPNVSGSSVEIDHDSDDLLVEFILPSSPTITERGGSGYEYWTTFDGGGTNPDPSPTIGTDAPNEIGSYRLEVSPPSSNTSDTYLVVMQAGADGITMPTINSLSGTGYIGVHIEDSTENVVGIFNNAYSSSSNASISYSITPTTGVRHVVSGLSTSTTFSVNGAGSYDSGASGTIEFTSLVGTTSFSIAEASDSAPPTLDAITIQSDGDSTQFDFSENMQVGSDGYTNFDTLVLSGGSITLSNCSITDDVVECDNSRTVVYGETFTSFAYPQPGDGLQDPSTNILTTIATYSGSFSNLVPVSTVITGTFSGGTMTGTVR